jgi:hypothetical protein
MFRNKDEAYAYATEWLEPVCGMSGETSAYPGQDCPGAPTEPPYDPLPDTLPHEWGSIPDEAITEIVSAVEDALDTVAGETVNVQDEVAQILKKYGCAGSLSGCVLLWAAAAVVALCKRED